MWPSPLISQITSVCEFDANSGVALVAPNVDDVYSMSGTGSIVREAGDSAVIPFAFQTVNCVHSVEYDMSTATATSYITYQDWMQSQLWTIFLLAVLAFGFFFQNFKRR